MKERPILMSAPMVRAILREIDPKEQTRRIVKPQPPDHVNLYTGHPGEHYWEIAEPSHNTMAPLKFPCPYGQPGDRLWVKETHAVTMEQERRNPHTKFPYAYRADWSGEDEETRDFKWKPSIFCTRAASRITLEITGIRVERLQEISEEDAAAEGVDPRFLLGDAKPDGFRPCLGKETAVAAYAALWESINGPGSWDANPWVWVIEFRRLLQ